MKAEALKLALDGITKVPTLTHGILVKLADVEAALQKALAQPPLPVQPEQGSLEELRQMLQIEVDRLIAAKAPVQPQRQPLTDEQRTALRESFAQALTSVYVCGRVWEAWSVGTMSESDFQPASECAEVLDALAEAAHNIGAKP